MTREEAIRRIKAWNLDSDDREVLEVIIPELRESEAEKRMKAIAVLKQQRYFWSYDGPSDKTPPATTRKELVEAIDVALPYLEKQKEQKPAEWSEEDDNAFNYLHELISFGYTKKVFDARTAADMWEWLDKRLRSPRPQLKQEWTDDDEQHLKWLCRIIHSRKNNGELSLTEEAELGNWIDKWINHNPQPHWKQEWGKEDERVLKGIIDEIEANKNDAPDYDIPTYNRFLSWLKSLPERFNLEPKQEWSEEDERVIRDACCWLAEYAGYLISENAYDTAEKLWKLSEKLKSLRPSMSDYKVGDKIIWDGKEYTIGACYPQPKQEWSEADEENISKLHRLLVICQGEKKFIPTSEYEKLDSWLTSLRPLWKPTEEHLSALLAIINDPNNIWSQTCQLALSDLYEHLKRLKKYEGNANEDNT